MNKNLYVVLMAGGIGTRFWPFSRNLKPKQFLDVLGIGKTLIQTTFERYQSICPAENVWIVTHEELSGLVQEQLPMIHSNQILAEPMRKNTAPCIAYAANKILLKDPDAVMIVCPTDHLILSEKEFLSTIQKAVDQARSQDKLITLGIQPTRPETGYGYIQFLEGKSSLKKVKTFTEKPAIALAKTFLASGDFVWNSGIFVWGVKAILGSFHKYLPELYEAFEEIRPQMNTVDEKRAVTKVYAQTKNISIDYGVMEKADNVYVSLGNFSWSDLGSWAALHEVSKKDDHNNVVNGESLVYETRNSVIKGSSDQLLV
ncbi:MAG TPA: mannose-1-phosphate guanylyltransferase, partial [Cyclobacteriaceae bacterium]|nr:mannose-1-phosphate guanylyltransferase [Cyclobacteriaceae bacterium]